MSEKGKITIGVGVDSAEAIQGLNELDQGLNKLAKEAEEFGETVSEEFETIDRAAKENAKALGKSTDKSTAALKKQGEQAKETGKETREGLDSTDAIEGLDSLKDTSGEVSSSMGAMGGAIGIVNPQLGALTSQVGALAGGLEGSAKLTAVFGGNLGSLVRVGGGLAVGVGALVVAYRKFSGGLEVATQRLKESHEAMREGIAESKVYGARLRSLKFQLGLVTQAEMDRRAAEEGALDLMGERAVKNAENINEISALNTAMDQNAGLLEKVQRNIVHVSGVTHTLTSVQNDLVGSLENGTIELQGQSSVLRTSGNNWLEYGNAVRTLERTGNIAIDFAKQSELAYQFLNEETADLVKTNLDMAVRIEQLERSTDHYNTTLDRNAAMIAITNAIQSGNIESMVRARSRLDDLAEAQRDTARATLEAAIQAEKQALAAERSATAAERNRIATEEGTEATEDSNKADEARARALDMVAQAQGEQAVLLREYKQEMADIRALVAEGAFETQAEQLEVTAAALKRFTDGLRDLKTAEEDEVDFARQAMLERTKLTVSETEQITNSFNQRIQDLETMREEDLANAKNYNDKIAELEDQKNQAVFEAQRRAAETQIQTAAMVGQTIASTVNSFADMMLQDLKNEEEEALAAAGDNLEEQEKIRAEFEKKRQKEMARVFKIQKGVEIANVGIAAASASIAALAMPPTGLGPVLGAALIPFIVGTAAAQMAVIASKKPSFHQGGIVEGGPGDQPIMAQAGEVVLSRSAVASMGGAEAANQLNEGGAPGRPVVVQMTYKNRVFDQIVVDNLAKGGPLKNALNRATNRGKRGRVGGRL